MTDEAAATSERLKVFVSYSRTDLDFSDQLVFALEDKGFEALVDRHDIDAAEKWKDRLGALIASCDTVVFVLSEKSAGSPICRWEVEEAARLGKRIIPVMPRDSTGVPPPPQLGELNYIHFFKHPNVPDSGFYDGVRKLDRALRVNLDWLRRGTKLAEQASDWARRNSADLLLRGVALEEGNRWRAECPPGSTISPIVREYLEASESAQALVKAEAERLLIDREQAIERAETLAGQKSRSDRSRTRALLVAGLMVILTIFSVAASAYAMFQQRVAAEFQMASERARIAERNARNAAQDQGIRSAQLIEEIKLAYKELEAENDRLRARLGMRPRSTDVVQSAEQ